MVLDTLALADRYAALHPGFAEAFAFLSKTTVAALPQGRHDIAGDRIFVLIDHRDGRGRHGARLEAHRRYIDIQYTCEGMEEIGWSPLAACRPPAGGYDEAKDIAVFDDRPATWLSVPPGHFVIFFPDDAHAPLGGQGLLKKAVIKVALRD
ncbi:MAG TPA: YhcH/YjgK/YiaL family protein [Vicinamibacterales bacterium]|nr:YhcH/YjgK/YiaL family protein [Vicinamibacterales bacterium]